MIDKNRLKDLAAAQSIVLTDAMLEQLDLYAELLVEWNQKINLTAITDPRQIEEKHFVDSLVLAAQPELQKTLLDVGSGAGFPGMVVKLYRPEIDVTLMEPTGKRLRFLQELAQRLQLPVHCVAERAEEAARKTWRERFDVVTARAVAALPMLCEYCLPLVRVGGVFIAMKGRDEDELPGAANAIQRLGGGLAAQRPYTLPDGSRRNLILIRKQSQTPAAYPRNGGVIKKRPL